MVNAYLKLSIAALLPVITAAALYILLKRTPFGKLPRTASSAICGIVFGVLAIIGTEWGIPMNGAQVNCRDSAVLIAGLFFGAPAGVIAGLIGGIERWIAVAWGVGSFTRVACTVSTIIAGFYAAALRKFLFEDRKPGGLLLPLGIGIVMETFHLTMVFLTNMATPEKAMEVVKACSIPMITANGVSVMLAALLLLLIAGDRKDGKRTTAHISQTIQRWLMVTVVLAFIATSFFIFRLQDSIAMRQTESELTLALNEVNDDVIDTSDKNMRKIAEMVKQVYGVRPLSVIASEYGIAEISRIDKNGIIKYSTNPAYIGFDMASGAQSAEFLCLLDNETAYVQDYGPISRDNTIYRKYAGIKTDDGFLQIGYDTAQFHQSIADNIKDISKNRHVGSTGYVLVLNENGDLVSAPKDEDTYAIWSDITCADIPEEAYTVFEATLNAEPCYCCRCETEGYSIISVLPKEEALSMRNIALYVNTFMEILVFAVLFGLIYLLIKRVVVNQLKSVNTSLAKITGGDLDELVNVRTNAEFASLSDDINSTVAALKHYIDEASARIDAELEFAKNIQTSALPNVFPAFPKRKDFDIYASMDPAKEVGGDFYDFYMTGTDQLNFLIADVSGKGIPAAMFMMRAKTELKSLTEAEVPLSEVFTHGNAALCEGNDAGMFVTAWQGGIDLTTGMVHYANAGHNPPLVRHENGRFEYLRSRAGFVLAGMDGVIYKTQKLQLLPGDVIFLYTDGVTEATNADNELYGEERLLSAINSQEFASMQELCCYVKADVDDFVGEAPQFDDITMVALKFIGTPPAPEIFFDAAQIADIPVVTDFVDAELEKLDCPMKTEVQMNVAIDEIYSNIVKYGYPKKPGPVRVQVIIPEDRQRVSIRFEDSGIPYNPLNVADPDITLSAEDRKIGGLGIYMVKKSMDEMKYMYEDDKNILTITKKL